MCVSHEKYKATGEKHQTIRYTLQNLNLSLGGSTSYNNAKDIQQIACIDNIDVPFDIDCQLPTIDIIEEI